MSEAVLHMRPGACLTYTLRQIASRDEIVFKSVVRVLQGKTRHAWQYTDTADADLVLMGAPDEPEAHHHGHHGLIRISTPSGAGAKGLTLPLRIADVISCLDQAGDAIAKRIPGIPAIMLPVPPHNVPAPLQDTRCGQLAGTQLPVNQRVSLLRWPDMKLLQHDPRCLKLATVLTGQPVSIVELAARTQFPLQLCQNFVEALKAGELLRLEAEQPEVAAAPVSRPMDLVSLPVPLASPARPPEHHGLIARIRSRLEMIVRTPAVK